MTISEGKNAASMIIVDAIDFHDTDGNMKELHEFTPAWRCIEAVIAIMLLGTCEG